VDSAKVKRVVDSSSFWVALALVIVATGVAVYDVFATFTPDRWRTASDVIGEWSIRWPILPFLAGLLTGHLFWRRN
jgi:uncharacterized protein YjeT (DUF2065 family)